MLKRTLIIGILTAVALALMAAAPPEIPYWEVGNSVEYRTESEVITFIWGVYDGEPGTPPIHSAPPPDRSFIGDLPSEALALLPLNIRAMFESGGLGEDIDEDTYACAHRTISPYPEHDDGPKVKTYGGIACLGDVIRWTSINVRLKRVSTVLDEYNNGWVQWLAHGKTVKGDCKSGTYRYEGRLIYAIQFINGSIARHPVITTWSQITC